MVFQHFNLFNNLTVLQNLTFAPTQLKLKTAQEAEQQARKLLARIGLSDKADVYPATLLTPKWSVRYWTSSKALRATE